MQTELTIEVKVLVRFNMPPSDEDLGQVTSSTLDRLAQAALNGPEGPIGEDWTPVGSTGNTFRLKGSEVQPVKAMIRDNI